MEAILVAVITGGLTLIGTIISNSSNHSKTIYRIEQLEKKQDIHNGVIERMYKVEKAIEILDDRQKSANHRISDLEDFQKSQEKGCK